MRLEAANLTDKLVVTFESIEVVRPIETFDYAIILPFTLIWEEK